MQPDFNRLHVFYQIYRLQSVAGAAVELCVTQSAVSQNLQKLEQEIGVPLFHRLHKRLVPTSAGERLYQTTLPFFSTLGAELAAINSSQTTPGGLLRLGAPPIFGSEVLPKIIAAFQSNYPLVTFQLTLGAQSVIACACRNGELDVALVDIFGTREEQSWNLSQEPLLDEPLVLIGSSNYVRKHLHAGPRFEALSRCRFIAYKSFAPELTDWFLRCFGKTVRQLDIVLTVENVHAVISAVRHHMGLGIAPLYLVNEALQKKELEAIRVGKNEIKSRISLLRLAGRNPGIGEKLFIEFLKDNLVGHSTK